MECSLSGILESMSQAFARADTREATERRLALLTDWRMGGRSSEFGFIAYGALKWSRAFNCAYAHIKQSKTAKLKYVVLVSGATRHADWMLAWGDMRVMERGRNQQKSGTCWLIPSMQGKSSGTKLTEAIKGLQTPGRPGALKKYEHVSLESLPTNPTAAGIRPGASDFLAIAMPAEIGVHTTGHDLTGLSALWEYIGCKLANCIPGAVRLAGFPPFRWGELGKGPMPTSLEPLVVDSVRPVSMSLLERILERYADCVLYIDEHQPLQLRQGGNLRPLVLATVATMIMYYEERFTAEFEGGEGGEASKVNQTMRDYFQPVMNTPRIRPHAELIRCGP